MPDDVVRVVTVRISESFGDGGYVSLAEIVPIAG